jgi:hypothetical protein
MPSSRSTGRPASCVIYIVGTVGRQKTAVAILKRNSEPHIALTNPTYIYKHGPVGPIVPVVQTVTLPLV